jgi:4-amino-4-deoxy-L-arabinose transferase-like glycosyltransferase
MSTMAAEQLNERWSLAVLVAILFAACALRIVPWTSNHHMGYDESFYRKYVLFLDRGGIASYPDVCAAYLEDGQAEATPAKVPPLRMVFVVGGLIWKRCAFGSAGPANMDAPSGVSSDPALISLHRVATFFACLALVPAWGMASRIFRRPQALAVLGLFACSPLLIHLSQHGFVDGVFATCAMFTLWTLLESLRKDARPVWLIGYAISFALLVLTKENALFVGLAVSAIMLGSRWLGLGPAGIRHWAAAFVGGLVAIAILTWAAGGFRPMLEVYLLFIRKVQALPYGYATGRGPWYRYLVDLLMLAPATLCFAIGGAFETLTKDRRAGFLLLFLAITYAVMCNVQNGMNLRYASIWEFPLRVLAVVQIGALAERLPRQALALALMAGLLCAIDLWQYHHFFVTYSMYDPVPESLLRAVQMLK